MGDYQGFADAIKESSAKFKEMAKGKNIRLISHLDSDGICAASIMIKALLRQGISYSLSIVPQITDSLLKEFSNEKYDVFIFTDLGSGHMDQINEYLNDKYILILDHHIVNDRSSYPNTMHINPHLFGIDGSKEISGSGVVYSFCRSLDERNKDMSHVAIIGAIGDSQESQGFGKLNEEILKTAVEMKKIRITKGLRFFGLETKPLYKLLAYITEPLIPGISGNEANSIEFMKSIGINPFIGNKERKFYNLTSEEKEKLIQALILKRSGEKNPEDILGDIYHIVGEAEGSPTKDAREFSTLLNACGRLNRSSLGIGTCLNDPKIKKMAIEMLKEYRNQIIRTIQWYEKNKTDSSKVIKGKNFIILKPGDEILPTLIGTLCSIIARGKDIEPSTYIMSLAAQDDLNIKVSIRFAGDRSNKSIDVKSIVEEITNQIGGQSGGHRFAAGAIIDPSIAEEFIESAITIFNAKHKENIILNHVD